MTKKIVDWGSTRKISKPSLCARCLGSECSGHPASCRVRGYKSSGHSCWWTSVTCETNACFSRVKPRIRAWWAAECLVHARRGEVYPRVAEWTPGKCVLPPLLSSWSPSHATHTHSDAEVALDVMMSWKSLSRKVRWAAGGMAPIPPSEYRQGNQAPKMQSVCPVNSSSSTATQWEQTWHKPPSLASVETQSIVPLMVGPSSPCYLSLEPQTLSVTSCRLQWAPIQALCDHSSQFYEVIGY